nr:3-hydroxyacyl-CoA dehydrogenase [Microlunatus panaciterrae]
MVAVIGLGTMGAGIAEVFARSGYRVRGIENDAAALERGRSLLQKSTARAVARGKLEAEGQQQLLGRIDLGTDLSAVADCSLVVEAVSERLDLKTALFAELDRLAPPEALLATNTSSLSITAIAAATARPERVIGVHFFNPAPVQTLVEVIRTVSTSDDTVERTYAILRTIQKTPIGCGDRAGFVVNALLIAYLNRAVRLYQDGFASREEIDQSMVDLAGYPMGPLALLDLIGLDVAHAVLVRMYDETRDRLHAPAPLLTQLVTAGRLGRKSGRGFYGYSGTDVTDEPGPVKPPPASRAAELPDTLVMGYLNDACAMVQSNYATPDDIDTGMVQGCRMPAPFDVLAQYGPATVLAGQRQLFAETAEPGHRPALLLERLAAADDPQAALAALRTRS